MLHVVTGKWYRYELCMCHLKFKVDWPQTKETGVHDSGYILIPIPVSGKNQKPDSNSSKKFDFLDQNTVIPESESRITSRKPVSIYKNRIEVPFCSKLHPLSVHSNYLCVCYQVAYAFLAGWSSKDSTSPPFLVKIPTPL